MVEKIKRAFFALIIVIMLAAGFGCATSASVGLGYHIPVSPRVGTGVYFGIGF